MDNNKMEVSNESKILKEKESLKEMMQQQIKEKELNQSSKEKKQKEKKK